MRRVAVVVALIGTLASAGGTATSAFALPEFSPPFPKAVISESGASLFETVGKDKIECMASKNAGVMTAPEKGEVTITFTGCKLLIPGAILPCNTEGAAPEEIVTKSLAATLGYIKHTAKTTAVGLELGFGEAPIAFIKCGEVHVLIIGSFIGHITPINKVVKAFPAGHFALTFSQAGGKQKPKHFEGKPPDLFGTSFGGGPFEETGFASKDHFGFPEPVMITA